MSTETASSTSVGTSTSSLDLGNRRQHRGNHVAEGKSSCVTGNVGSGNEETDFRGANFADMDLVNGSNPWLPAYGFQLQHQQHNQQFEPTHEDLRGNDAALVQQVDFLETIVEETSDDLQSDSDRSGTTYWLGSDSETESVIHIKTNQPLADERPDGSGSECNSVVPKKRRRRNASNDRDPSSMTIADDQWLSPRSSRSSESSSRSSSLLQFESLERTCATVSPSGYSYDSLEYSNRSNSHVENTSPDSLDEDCDVAADDESQNGNSRVNGFATDDTNDGYPKLRPYRSFESLETCRKIDDNSSDVLRNGFSASFCSKTSNDLSSNERRNDRDQRNFWHGAEIYEEDDEYEDYEDEDIDDDDDDADAFDDRESPNRDPYDDSNFPNFTDSNVPNYSTSLDFRNAMDLREIGIETRRDLLLDDLKSIGGVSSCGSSSSSSSSRVERTSGLNIDDGCGVVGNVGGSDGEAATAGRENGERHRRHHHHHQRRRRPRRRGSPNRRERQHRHARRGRTESSGFNFRFTDKSRSAPSLPNVFDETGNEHRYPYFRSSRTSDYYTSTLDGTLSSSIGFENYTRVASVPIDLNLCGRNDNDDNPEISKITDVDANSTTSNDVVDRRCPEKRTENVANREMGDDSGVSGRGSTSSSKSSEKTDSEVSRSGNRRNRGTEDVAEDSEMSVKILRGEEVDEVKSEDIGGGVSSKIVDDRRTVAKTSSNVENFRSDDDDDEDDDDTVEEASDSGVAENSFPETTVRPKSTVKTQDRDRDVLEIAMAMENDIDAVVDEAIRQFKREVEEATGNVSNDALTAIEVMKKISGEKSDVKKFGRRVKNNASYELAQQFVVDEKNIREIGKMTSCAEDDGIESIPNSPGTSGAFDRRRVANNASYELAQQHDCVKSLESKNSRAIRRMDACDERPEFPRPTITCGIKVSDLVREMSRDQNSSIATSGIFSDDEIFGDDKIDELPKDDDKRDRENFRTGSDDFAKGSVEKPSQESLLDQIKKNSDQFSASGESGNRVSTVDRLETNNDDEIDYPCLEIKSIINENVINDPKINKSTTRNDDSSLISSSPINPIENDSFTKKIPPTSNNDEIRDDGTTIGDIPQRRPSFLGEFYPETKKSNKSYQISNFQKNDENNVSDDNDDRAKREKSGERLWRVVMDGKNCSTEIFVPSDGRDDSSTVVSAVVPETTDATKLRRRKKDGGTVAIGIAGLNGVTATSVAGHVGNFADGRSTVCPVTSIRTSPPRLITTDRIGVGRSVERNGGSSSTGSSNASLNGENRETVSSECSVVSGRGNKKDLDQRGRTEVEDNTGNDNQITAEKIVTSGSPEMSATAAKRLAMGSPPGAPKRINEFAPTIAKSDSSTAKNNDKRINNVNNVAPSPTNDRKKGGLGGFLQRFSRLRFSGRAKVPRSEIGRTNDDQRGIGETTSDRNKIVRTMDEQPGTTRRKNEPDYIIIPLHGPEDEGRTGGMDEGQGNDGIDGEIKYKPRRSTDLERSASCASPNGRPPVSSKPPLPPGLHPGVGGCARGLSVTSATTPTSRSSSSSSSGVVPGTRRRAATDLGSLAAIEMAKARAMQAGRQEPRPVGLLETDLDAAEPASPASLARVDLTDVNGASAIIGRTVAGSNNQSNGKKTRSLLNLNHTSGRQGRDVNIHQNNHHHNHHHHNANDNALRVPQSPGSGSRTVDDRQDHHHSVVTCINQRPHKSMEFLLDKENLHFVKPPENELQKVGERVPSEHELRVQRSLQRLNVPDWYKNSPAARDGFRLKRHSDASQHGGWRSLGSKTTSLSSLSSSSNRQPTAGILLSPSPTPPVFSRWSTSLLNSAGSSPASSARSSFNHRQPYLGWRSQERLANPRTPAERLAQGILPQLQSTQKQQQQQEQQQHQHQQNHKKEQTNQQLEVRNSIKEVTSAIVHYVQSGQEVFGGGRLSPRPRPDDWDDRGGARSTSPRGSVRLCWMESSFVGSRPVDSPETPMSLATDTECCAGCNATGNESCSCVDSATSGLYLDLTPTTDDPEAHSRSVEQQQRHGSRSLCPSPSSTSNYHQPANQHHNRHRHNVHRQQLQEQHQQQQQQQRHHRGSGQSEDEEAMATAALLRNKPSPGSTTLEDVLDSLLGLPSASRTPSPGPGPLSGSTSIRHHRPATASAGQPSANAGKSCSDLRQDLQGRRTIVR